MTYSIFDELCGFGGSGQGLIAIPGFEMKAVANHLELALEVQVLNHGDGLRLLRGNIQKQDVENFTPCDFFWASPACFAAGTTVLTKRGLVPIEQVKVGDEVFTHRRRWRPVVETKVRRAPTVRVKGLGLRGGIVTTAEHPFYTRTVRKVWRPATRRYEYGVLSPESEWTPAGELTAAHQWATPLDFGEPLPTPDIPGRPLETDGDFWWMVGRWLGDGHLTIQSAAEPLPPIARQPSRPAGSPCTICGDPSRPARRGQRLSETLASPYCESDACRRAGARKRAGARYELSISCGRHETEELDKRLRATGLTWQHRSNATADQFTTSHRGLVEWLREHFGCGASGKTVPAWALTLPSGSRAALLDGYLSADGHVGHYTEAGTVSKRLALGVRMLANSLGHVANIKGPYQRPAGRLIQGRPVNELPTYTISWITDGPERLAHRDDDGFRWGKVRPAEPTGATDTVYNLSVAEDETYLADGIVVHNCPPFSNARGEKVDFDNTSRQASLFDDEETPEQRARRLELAQRRALMDEVPRYLRAMADLGKPVLAGCVENVIQARKWSEWARWIQEIRNAGPGYHVRVIALNAVHARGRKTPRVPQNRNRLFVAYSSKALGRVPDWNKWLRPKAYCGTCDQMVYAVQVFKDHRNDMGAYGRHGQYWYRCPNARCKNSIVHPEVSPALAALNLNLPPGPRIGDRERLGLDVLEESTMNRIGHGLVKIAGQVMLVPTGGTWREEAYSALEPMPTRTTRETDGLVLPPLIVPTVGASRGTAYAATEPLKTQTARRETAVVLPQFISMLRGGGSVQTGHYTLDKPLATFSAQGGHHALVGPPEALLMSYYGNGSVKDAREPIGTLTTRDRYAVLRPGELPKVEDCTFRMLDTTEIAAGMGFFPDWKVKGNKRQRTAGYGNAVPPACAEVIGSALFEVMSGETLPTWEEAA